MTNYWHFSELSLLTHNADESHHVPEKVGDPVDQRADSTNKLQMLGLGDTFLNEVEDEAGWDEGHGKDDANGHHCIHWCGETVQKEKQHFTQYKKTLYVFLQNILHTLV